MKENPNVTDNVDKSLSFCVCFFPTELSSSVVFYQKRGIDTKKKTVKTTTINLRTKCSEFVAKQVAIDE